MMDAQEVISIIDALVEDCQIGASDCSHKRLKALDFFRGNMEAYLPSDDGRSSMVSKDIRAVIKKVVPSLKRTILGSDKIVEYKPIGPEDERAADDATIYVNKVVIPECRADDAISDAILSALLLDEGFLTWYHQEKKVVRATYHSGIGEAELAALQSDPTVEILESEPYEADIMGAPETLYRARIKRIETQRQIRLEAVPAEDMIIHPDTKAEDDSPLIGHIMRLRRSDLVAMGYDRAAIDELPETEMRSGLDFALDSDREARNPDDFNSAMRVGDGIQGAMQEIEVYRLFVRVDADDDGIAELREIHYVPSSNKDAESRILFDDYADEACYAVLVAERIMHSWQGVSIFDDVEELQTLKTVLMRQILDNLYQSNNPQPYFQVGAVLNPEAVFSPEIGNPVQVKQGVSPGDAIQWRNIPFFADKAIGMLDKADGIIVDRTGITAAAGGLDPDALQNVRQKGVEMISDAASAQAWCIGRELTRGGLKRAFKGILKLVVQHQDKPRQVKLGKDWRPFDPRSWNAEMDCEVNTGLGTGTRERDMQALQVVMMQQEKIITTMGGDNPFVTPGQYYSTLSKIVEAAGLPSADVFFTDPGEGASFKPPGPQGPSPEEMKMQHQMQVEQMKMQVQRDKESAQAEADVTVKQAEMEKDFQKFQMEGQHRQMEANTKIQIEQMKIESAERIAFAKLQQDREIAHPDGVHDIDDETGERKPSQIEVLSMTMRDVIDNLVSTQALLAAPKRKTAVGPGGKTYEITERLDMGDQMVVN